ncbi:excalibur calcium-binding domain-containing protein [Nocardia niwae]|uniref:excalibur calcium-binding domain-containing protein n=1 Tax=Nocardia niwae TaxID=626084 RepID=UPI000A04B25E
MPAPITSAPTAATIRIAIATPRNPLRTRSLRTRTSGSTLPRSPFELRQTDTPDKPGYATHLDRDNDGVACE